METFYIDYGYSDDPKLKSGKITICSFDLEDKPDSFHKFFEVSSISEDYGCIIVNQKGYIPYYSCAEDYYKFFSSENFGDPETSFIAALQKLVNNLSDIVFIGDFYKIVQTTVVAPVESP